MSAPARTAAPPVPAVAPSRGGLLQVLGVAFGIAIIVGNTIGAGILRTPGSVASLLPSTPAFLLAWIAGGAYAFLGTLSFAELGVLLPHSGGQYVFARAAFGRYAGFVIGWTDWISVAASAAAVSIVVGEYATALLPALGPRSTSIAIASVLTFTVLQWRGVRWSDRVQQATSLAKALAFMALIVACFALAPAFSVSAPAAAVAPPAADPFSIAAIVLAMQAVIYTYDGWNGLLYFSGEVRDPDRQIPRAMISGVLTVIAIYVLLNLAIVHVLGMGALARSDFAAGAAARALWGDLGDTIIRSLLVVSLLSAVNAMVLQASRVPFAMSVDGLFPRIGTTVNTGGTPTVTLALTAATAITFLLTGTFESVIAVAAFFFVLQYVTSFAAVFRLRRSMPDAPRAYRAWAYPWSTGFSLLGGVAFLVGAILSDRRNSLVALGILAASYPVYALSVGRRAGRSDEPSSTQRH